MRRRGRLCRLAGVVLSAVTVGSWLSVAVVVLNAGPAAASTYSSAVLADSPVAYWRLGESSGTTAADSSGNGHGGTYTSTGVSYGASAIVSDGDTAVSFSGGSMTAAASTALNIHSGTIEGWIQGGTQSGTPYLFGKPGTIDAYLGSGGDLRTYDNSTGTELRTGVILTDNQPHYIVITYQSGVTNGTKVYVDTHLVLVTTLTYRIDSLPFSIGDNSCCYSVPYHGTIDEVAFYNTLLSPSRMATHYQAGGGTVASALSTAYSRAVKADSPALYLRLGESAGPLAVDASGNDFAGSYSSSGITKGTAGLVGDSDTAASFSGGVVQVMANPSLNLTTGTIEGWVKGTTPASGTTPICSASRG
jgi:hypothetical protein